MFVIRCTLSTVLFCLYFTCSHTSVNVSLYYESLCSDSVNFITGQLYPSYQAVGPDIIDLDLVPFGKAQVKNISGNVSFICQHGPRECYGNKVQSCVIFKNPIESSMDFINCVMGSGDPAADKYLKYCAQNHGVSWKILQDCLESGEADDLLVKNGIRTKAVHPKITFIPTIVFNGKFNNTLQRSALIHFLKTVCDLIDNKARACSGDIKAVMVDAQIH